MNFFPFAATAVTMLGLYLAGITLKMDSEAPLNRTFAAAVIIISVFTFLTGILTVLENPESIQILLRIIGILHIFYLLSTIMIAFVYSQIKMRWLILYLIVHIPYDVAVAVAVWQDQWLFSGYHPSGWGNVIELNLNSPWILADYGRGLFDFLVGMALLIITWKKNTTTRKKQVILIVLFTTLLVTLLTFYLKIIIWLEKGYPDYSPLTIVIGFLVYLIIITRYGHLKETKPVMQKKLLYTLGGTLLFTDNQGQILEAPPAMEGLLNQKPLKGCSLFTVLPSWADWENRFAQLHRDKTPLDCGIKSINKTEFRLKIIPQIHKMGDLEGCFILLEPVQSLDAICRRYEITPREKEVITLLIEGYSNKEIAKKLFISYATAKNHMHKILMKTDNTSRIELLRFLLTETKK